MTSLSSKYLALGNATFQQQLAYRNVFFISLAGHTTLLFSMYYLWEALYSGKSNLGGFDWVEMQTYLLLTFFGSALVSMHSEMMVSYRILDGSVAIDLLKPLDYQTARLAETLTTALLEGLGALLVVSVVAAILGASLWPSSGLYGLLGFVSFGLGVLIKFGVIYLSGMVCFWTTNGWGVSFAQTAVSQLFSGALVPLPFLPGWLRVIADWLPFKGMIYSPISIYLGRVDLPESARILGWQALWVVGLWVLGKSCWSIMMRKVTIHGG